MATAREVGISIAVALVAFAGCGHEDAHHLRPADPPVPVAVATAHEESLAELYLASGTVRGRTTITLTSKISGYVRAVSVRAGDRVTAGQVLVDLEANDVRAGVSRGRAELDHATESRAEAASAVEAARITADLAKTSRDRVDKLFTGGAVTRQEYDEADSKWHGASAQLAMAEARLRAASSGIDVARAGVAETQATLDYARVIAPFTGRVVERRIDPGALASPGTALLVLDDEASLRVEASVEESRGATLRLGDVVSVTVGDAALTGKIGELSPSVDVASRGFIVKIDLDGKPDLRPGTFARVAFRIGERLRLVVPTSAISVAGALDRVFVIDHGFARLRMITAGERQGQWTEVLSGLSAAEQVVTDPGRELRDASPVEARR
ncbi:efflux RND transporter periplasmic adaptor subunit [soil metagenome]